MSRITIPVEITFSRVYGSRRYFMLALSDRDSGTSIQVELGNDQFADFLSHTGFRAEAEVLGAENFGKVREEREVVVTDAGVIEHAMKLRGQSRGHDHASAKTYLENVVEAQNPGWVASFFSFAGREQEAWAIYGEPAANSYGRPVVGIKGALYRWVPRGGERDDADAA